MKKFLLICCMLLFLCSCTQGPVTEDNIPPNNSYEKDSASADAEEINITSMLSLQQDQSYVVCDYFEGIQAGYAHKTIGFGDISVGIDVNGTPSFSASVATVVPYVARAVTVTY